MAAQLIAIAVVAANGVIGDGRDQPFKFTEDWARFKRTTMGHPMVMGRTTHDAMGLLPGRTSIVVSHDPHTVKWPDAMPEGSRGIAVSSVESALARALELDDLVFVIGGGQIYKACWPWLTGLDITEVHSEAAGEVMFPVIGDDEWREASREPKGEFDFVSYHRIGQARPLPGR
ncbi:dihydrofolate reductase [Propionibacterium sp.]|uniref:dihydrofolate reductase n=1 Tax=Propionibacterium sp. TaxID=1977903 RepID=UPI0039E84A4D